MGEASPSIGKHRCQAIRKDGQPCTVRAIAGSLWCFAHDPDRAAQRDEARRKGGRGKATSRRLRGLMPPRLVPVFDQLEGALSDVLAGGLDPKQATAAAAVARAMVSVLTAGELEERLRKLEEGQGQA